MGSISPFRPASHALPCEIDRAEGPSHRSRGKCLPDASIQLMEHGEVLSQTASGADGKFLVKAMSAGQFIIKAEFSGFRPFSRRLPFTR